MLISVYLHKISFRVNNLLAQFEIQHGIVKMDWS